MKHLSIALALSLSFATTTFATEARANQRGLELMVRTAYGSAPADSPVRYAPLTVLVPKVDVNLANGTDQPYGGGFVGSAFIGYRFASFMSVGLRGGYRGSAADKVNDGSTNVAREAWDAGFYLRAYPLAVVPKVGKYLDPWISVGAIYTRDVQAFDKSVTASNGAQVAAHWTLDHHAVAVPIGVGIDYRVLPMLSVGPSFEYAIAVPVAGCVAVSASGATGAKYCSGDPPGDQFMKANGYGVWSVGLQVRATF